MSGPTSDGAAPRALRWVAVGLLAVLLGAAAWYAVSLQRRAAPPPAVAGAPGVATSATAPASAARLALSDEQLQRMVEQAGAAVKKDPRDAVSWAMLAHSYDMLGKFAESSKAYAQLAQLRPRDAQVLVDYADALAVAQGRSMQGEPSRLVDRALALDPNNLKALMLAGAAALERKDDAQALAHWQRARGLSADPQFRQQIDAGIAAAQAGAKGAAAVAAPVPTPPAPPTSAGVAVAATVSGRVSLADDLVGTLPASATVFIFARPLQGSRMPVAVLRKHVSDLPIDFTLDDSMAMVKGMGLSKVPAVVIGALVSRRGDVVPQPGDVQGLSAPVPVGSRDVRLELSEVLK